jgi:hypothetical protein
MPGPISGNQIPPLSLPQGNICFYSGMVQSSLNQYIQLTDSKGTEVLVLTGSSSTWGTPTPLGGGYFTLSDSTYTIKIGLNNGASWSSVIYNQSSVDLNGAPFYQQYTFLGEDGGDGDYNDSSFLLYWFRSIG